MNEDELTQQVHDTLEQIKPLLKGKLPSVQAAVLADLLALWLAGHFVEGDAKDTHELREKLLADHCATVRELTDVNARILGTGVIFK